MKRSPSLFTNVLFVLSLVAVCVAGWAGTAQAVTVTDTYFLGEQGAGTTLLVGTNNLITWVPLGTLPTGSILRSVNANVSLDSQPPGSDSWASDIFVYFDHNPSNPGSDVTLQIGADYTGRVGTVAQYVNWGTGNGGPITAFNVTRVPGDGEWTSNVDLNTVQVSIGNSYSTATWSGTISVTYDFAGLIWTGGTSEWSTNPVTNWIDITNTPAPYTDGQRVLFDNSVGAGSTTVDISVADVAPASVLFDNNKTNTYTLTGTNGITGATGLTKKGDGELIINNVNTYTGPTTVNKGTLTVNAGTIATLNVPAGTASLNATARATVANVSGTGLLDINSTVGVLNVSGGTANLNSTATATTATVSGSGLLALDGAVTTLSVTGGTVNVGAGATAAIVALPARGATPVVYAPVGQELTVTNKLTQVGLTITADVSQPFKVGGENVVNNIDRIILQGGTTTMGQAAIPVTASGASASDARDNRGPEHTIDGSGLSGTWPDQVHDNGYDNVIWDTNGYSTGNEWISWDLGSSKTLNGAHVWNGNRDGSSNRGIQTADIEYSDNNTDWTTAPTGASFAQAPGANGYAGFDSVDFAGITGRYIRLSNIVNWGGDRVDLSEIAFYEISEIDLPNTAIDVTTDSNLALPAGAKLGKLTLIDSSELTLSSATSASFNGLAGNGSVLGSVIIPSGGEVSPGASIGAITITGDLSFSAGAIGRFEINSIGDMDHVDVTGDLTAAGGTIIRVTDGLASGAYSLIGYTGTASDISNFTLQNLAGVDPTSAYYLMYAGSALKLMASNSCTWTGESEENNYWQTPANWDTTPIFGDLLHFAGSNTSNNNNFDPGTTFTGIVFDDGADSFTLGGNSIILTGNIFNNSSNDQTIDLPMTITRVETIVNTGDSNKVTLARNISGPGGLKKAGDGTLIMSGANNDYAGATNITAGTLQLDGSLTDAGGLVTVSGGTLNLTAGGSIARDVTVSGGNMSLAGTMGAGTTLTLTSGLIATAAGGPARVVTADFSAGAGTVDASIAPLAITNTMKLPKDVTATYTAGGSATAFTVQGSDIANDTADRTLTLSGGTLTLVNPPAGPPVAGAMLWLNAAKQGTVTMDGGNYVSQWDNLAGSQNFTSSGTQRPLYVANAFGDLAGIRFDNNDDRLANTGLLGSFSASAATMFVVFNPRGDSAYNLTETGPAGDEWFRYDGNGRCYTGDFRGGRVESVIDTPMDNNTHIYSVRSSSSGWSIWIDGATATYGANYGINSEMVIGNSHGRPFGGDIGELVIYNSALSDADRQAVYDYLNSKWITGTGSVGGGNLTTTNITVTSMSTLVVPEKTKLGKLTLIDDAELTINGASTVSFNGLAGNGSVLGSVIIPSGGEVSPDGSIGTITVSGLTLESGSLLKFHITDEDNLDQVIVTNRRYAGSPAGGLEINGGAVTLLDYDTGEAFGKLGTYQLIGYVGSIIGDVNNLLVGSEAPLGVKYTLADVQIPGRFAGFVTLTVGAAGYWNGGGGIDANWSNSDNWNNIAPEEGDTLIFATAGDDGEDGAVTLLNNNLASGRSYANLVFHSEATDAFTLDGNSITLTGEPDSQIIMVNNSTLTQTVNMDIAMGADGKINANAGEIVVVGNISGAGFGLTKIGAGTLTLSGAGTSDNFGNLTVAGGTLALGGTVTVNTDALAIESEAKLKLNTGSTIVTPSITGAGTLNFDGGTLKAAADIELKDVATSISDGGAVIHSNGNTVTVNQVMDPVGNGGLTVQGAGSVLVMKAQTYAGATMIQDGGTLKLVGDPVAPAGASLWLNASNAASLALNADGSGGTPTNGQEVKYWAGLTGNSANTTGAAPTYVTDVQNGQSSLLFNGSNTLNLATAAGGEGTTVFIMFQTTDTNWLNPLGDGLHFSVGRRVATQPGGGGVRLGENMDGGPEVIDPPVQASTWAIQAVQVVAGDYKLWINNIDINDGGGTELSTGTIPASNVVGGTLPGYIGEVMIYDGILTDETRTAVYNYLNFKWLGVGGGGGSSNLLPVRTVVTMTSDTTLDLNNVNQQIASLDDAAPGSTTGHQILLGTGTLTVGGVDNLTSSFSGAIHGGGGLTKVGTGTLTLSGANDYTGDTIVEDGTLSIVTDTPWLSDTGAVKITSGAIMDLAFSSELPKDIVGEMWLNGVQMYGTFNSDTQPDYFTGIGSLFAQGYGNYWAPAVGGGQGEAEDRWTATVEKWAMAPGIQGAYMQAATGALIFTDATGTVYVDGPVTASSGMTFEVDDYNLAAGDSIDGNAPVINLTGANAAANTITVATDATATIGVDLTSATGMTKAGDGTLVLSGDANTGTGQVRLQNGTVNVTGGTLTSAGQLRVGVAAGENAVLNLSGGAVVSFTTPGEWQYIGESALGTAEMTMSGSSSFSAGSLHIEGSGTVTVNDATITLDGGIGLWVARFGGAGTAVLNINDGAILNVNRFNMSANNSVGTSIVYQTGGEMNIVATLTGSRDGNIRIGTTNGMTATYNISGGTLYVDGRLATSGVSPLQVGNGCTGTLNISGDGFVNMPYDSVTLGTAGTATGVLNLDGGTLLTTYISKGAGSGTFNFNGGTLKSAAASETFMQGLTAANVKSGGARIDSNSYNITIGQALLHDAGLGGTADGGLTKLGEGTLTLSGVNTYTGDTTVSEGTLTLADAEVAGQLKFIIGASGVNNKITGAGTVQLDGEFIFDMADAGDTLGDTWIIVDNATLAETFSSTFTLVDFTGGEGAGVLWSKPITSVKIYEFSEATGELKVKLAFAGDTNGDGVVDAVDYITLKTNFGMTEGATLEMGNFNADIDGDVDWDDLKILMANFGARSGGGAPAATPEPATLGLLAIGALALLRRRRTA